MPWGVLNFRRKLPKGNERGNAEFRPPRSCVIGCPRARTGQFLRRRGHGLDVGRRLLGRRRDGGGLAAGLLGHRGHALGRGLHGFGALENTADGAPPLSLHGVVEGHDLALVAAAMGFLLARHLADLDGVVLENLDRVGHLANFVAAPDGGNHGFQFPFGQLAHGPGHGGQGSGDAARDDNCQADGNEQQDGGDNEGG